MWSGVWFGGSSCTFSSEHMAFPVRRLEGKCTSGKHKPREEWLNHTQGRALWRRDQGIGLRENTALPRAKHPAGPRWGGSWGSSSAWTKYSKYLYKVASFKVRRS